MKTLSSNQTPWKTTGEMQSFPINFANNERGDNLTNLVKIIIYIYTNRVTVTIKIPFWEYHYIPELYLIVLNVHL